MTTDLGCVNLRWALALFDGLIAGGMRQLVLSPGSRSTPLVLAAQRQSAVTVTPIVDERSAAFVALGLARASGRPVGVLCTSGSALAHWLPAVIEAAESEIPLLLLSADRPPELRGWGANQTIDQTRLFGVQVRAFYDPGTPEATPLALKQIRALGRRAAAESLGAWPGPVHLNLPFREPLVPAPSCQVAPEPQPPLALSESADRLPSTIPAQARHALQHFTRHSGHGLICCGPGQWSTAGAAALWQAAARLGVPVLCDPLSGLRFGAAAPARITRYDSFLRHPTTAAALKPAWVLRIGRAPVSKTLLSWLADVPTLLVSTSGSWSDPNYDVQQKLALDPATACAWLAAESEINAADHAWLAAWRTAEQQIAQLAADYLAHAPWCEGQLIGELIAQLPADDGLLCANSMPIRQLDTWSGARAQSLRLFGNRGASGIDGQASTLAGLNAAGTPTTALLGDLSLLHDLSGLLAWRALERPGIVLNNGGGRIFDYLPQYGLPEFTTLWRTPIDIAFKDLARTFGLAHRQVSDGVGFRQALTEALSPQQPAGLIEVVIDADVSRQTHQGFWRVVRGAA